MKNISNPIEKFIVKNGSRTAAINAMCAQCVGCTENHLEPGFRTTIKECTSPKCALYKFRPYK